MIRRSCARPSATCCGTARNQFSNGGQLLPSAHPGGQ
jgi:hypothetical protein